MKIVSRNRSERSRSAVSRITMVEKEGAQVTVFQIPADLYQAYLIWRNTREKLVFSDFYHSLEAQKAESILVQRHTLDAVQQREA